MTTTNYSHAYLVGSFNRRVKSSKLDSTWEHKPLTIDEYNKDCGIYYKSHLDAMAELTKNKDVKQSRPQFLNDVKHYCHTVKEDEQRVILSGTKYNPQTKETEVVYLDNYYLKICQLHLYFFPLGITFFVIEIDDSGSELNELTQAHFWLMSLNKFLLSNTKDMLKKALSPLISLVNAKDCSELIKNGNKLKMFQIIQTSPEGIDDESALLYELSSSSAIGMVHTDKHMSPSEDYVDNILKNNVVSAFKEWKALALVDSFTVLSFKKRFDPWSFQHHYFPYIYMRCLFEKTFCFSRNNLFRLNKGRHNLAKEVMRMEKYYFYDDISYNFLPNMIYQAIAKGMRIKEEKSFLVKQIKEKADTNKNLILSTLSGLAIFTVCNSLNAFINNIYKMCSNIQADGIISLIMFGIALVISISVGVFLYSHKRI